MGERTDCGPQADGILASAGGAGVADLRQWPGMLMAAAVFAFLSLMAAVYSGGFLEADACTHYIYARFCLTERFLLTDVWGRPFCTAIYAIPALLGKRLGVRFMSMLIALTISLISYAIAKRQGNRWPGLAMIFVLGQPLLFLHSFSELTELPFALLVAMSLLAYQCRQWLLLAIIVGLMPTARPEGFGFLALAGLALIAHRRWYWLPVLLAPLPLWSLAGCWFCSTNKPWYDHWWLWLLQNWPYASESVYKRGWLIHFVVMMPAIVSPGAFPAVVLGIWRSLRWEQPGTLIRALLTDHRHRCQVIIAVLPLGILLGHSLLYWLGKMASNGELRYMLVVAPMWALLAATGWEWAFARLNWRSPLGWAGLAVLVPALFNGVYRVVPIQTTMEGRRAMVVAQWYQASGLKDKSYPRLIATCRDIYYYLDLSPNDKARSAKWHPKTINSDHRGIMLIWDPVYGMFNSDAELKMDIDRIMAAGWTPVHFFFNPLANHQNESLVTKLARKIQPDAVGTWIVFLSPQDASGRPTPASMTVRLPATQPAE